MSNSLYWQSLKPDEPPRASVVMVHGFGEHSGRLGPVAEAFLKARCNVWSFDLRGHGKSAGRRGHIRSWVEYHDDLRTVARLAKRESPDLPLFLFGHSMGGLVVLEFLLAEPDGLAGAVVSGPLLVQPDLPRIKLLAGRLLSRYWPAFSLRVPIDPQTLSRKQEERGQYEKDPLVHNRGTARLSTEVSRTLAWVRAHPGRVSRPLLIAHGGADRLVPITGSRDFASQADARLVTLIEYPQSRHELHHDEDCGRFLEDVISWLEARLPERNGPESA